MERSQTLNLWPFDLVHLSWADAMITWLALLVWKGGIPDAGWPEEGMTAGNLLRRFFGIDTFPAEGWPLLIRQQVFGPSLEINTDRVIFSIDLHPDESSVSLDVFGGEGVHLLAWHRDVRDGRLVEHIGSGVDVFDKSLVEETGFPLAVFRCATRMARRVVIADKRQFPGARIEQMFDGNPVERMYSRSPKKTIDDLAKAWVK